MINIMGVSAPKTKVFSPTPILGAESTKRTPASYYIETVVTSRPGNWETDPSDFEGWFPRTCFCASRIDLSGNRRLV